MVVNKRLTESSIFCIASPVSYKIKLSNIVTGLNGENDSIINHNIILMTHFVYFFLLLLGAWGLRMIAPNKTSLLLLPPFFPPCHWAMWLLRRDRNQMIKKRDFCLHNSLWLSADTSFNITSRLLRNLYKYKELVLMTAAEPCPILLCLFDAEKKGNSPMI